MATIFDRETLLDLTVNVVPLGIILIFGVGYLIFNPWADDGLFGNLLMIGLHVVPFVALAVLTYVSGKAIAGDEQRSSVFFQGQATLEDAQERHEAEKAAEADRGDDAETAAEPSAASDPDGSGEASGSTQE